MKKVLLFFMVLSMLALTGCELPFAPPKRNIILNYVDSNAEIMEASKNIDGELIKELKNIEKGEMIPNNTINDVWHSRDMQQELYEIISNQKSPYDHEKVKFIYLNVINSRIDSYNRFITSLEKDNYETFQSVVKKHELKDNEVMEKSLIELNYVIENLGAIKRDSLLPQGTFCEDEGQCENEVTDEEKVKNEEEKGKDEGENDKDDKEE